MKISIDKIIEQVLKEENLEDIEQIKSIYLKLGEIFTYNGEYKYIFDDRITKDIYDEKITLEKIEQSNYQNKITVICKQIEEILTEAINKISMIQGKEYIKAKTIGYEEEQEKHVITQLAINDKNYYLDLYKDLFRIQKGMKTKYFAPSKENLEQELLKYPNIKEKVEKIKFENISDKENEKIDTKIGYITNGIYTDTVIKMLKEEMKDGENLKKYIKESELIKKKDLITKVKIDFLFKNFKNNYSKEKTMKIDEINKFYKKIYHDLLEQEENEQTRIEDISIFLSDDTNNYNESILFEVAFLKENKIFYYIYEDKTKQCREIKEEELRKKEQTGELKYRNKYSIPKFKKREKEIEI